MLIREYFAELQGWVPEFPFLVSAALTFDERTSYLGLFKGQLTFRPHARRLVTFPHHKHTPTGLVASTPPTLVQVLDEIYQDMRTHLSW